MSSTDSIETDRLLLQPVTLADIAERLGMEPLREDELLEARVTVYSIGPG